MRASTVASEAIFNRADSAESAATAVGRELCPRRRLVCRWDGRGAGGSACYCGAVRPGGRRFSITVKMDLKIAAAIAAIG